MTGAVRLVETTCTQMIIRKNKRLERGIHKNGLIECLLISISSSNPIKEEMFFHLPMINHIKEENR
jgi:hypothetical protein